MSQVVAFGHQCLLMWTLKVHNLSVASIMPAQVDAAIAAIPDDQQRAVAEIEWEYATQFERMHPLIAQVGGAFGLTPEQIDGMWQAAMEL